MTSPAGWKNLRVGDYAIHIIVGATLLLSGFALSGATGISIVDVLSKVVLQIAAPVGALWAFFKFLHEQSAALRAEKLSLRRDAYFGYLASIPTRSQVIARIFSLSSELVEIPIEVYNASARFQLIAPQATLALSIETNGRFHQLYYRLSSTKQTALFYDNRFRHLVREFRQIENEDRARGRRDEIRRELSLIDRHRKNAWTEFTAMVEEAARELGKDYAAILKLARSDLGELAEWNAIEAAFQSDWEKAVEIYKRNASGFSHLHIHSPEFSIPV